MTNAETSGGEGTGPGFALGRLVPILLSVSAVYFVVGLALPVVPIHVNHDLGLSTFVVGLVAGSQFAASFLTRIWVGRYSDTRGPKRALIAGLGLAGIAGAIYLASLLFLDRPAVSAAVLLTGRAVLGAAESFVTMGGLTWAMRLSGPEHAGRVMALVGMAMYGALAVGSPGGAVLYDLAGFAAVAVATLLLPLGALPLARAARGAAVEPHPPVAIGVILRAIWRPSLGLAASSIGFGAMTAFVALLSVERGWGTGWLLLSAFTGCFMLVRMVFGSLPDRLGGALVALVSVAMEAAGLVLIWAAPGYGVAVIGAAISGTGYSLVYPGFGVEAVRRVASQSRGTAMGIYTAFLDLALAVASPLLGLVAAGAGLGAVFLVAAGVVSLAMGVALYLLGARGRGG